MTWTNNQIILNQRDSMNCKDLFQAVCDELGQYYEKRGFKYTRSKHKLTYKDKEIKLDIGFNSSRSNTAGSHVALEILPNFYSLDIIKQDCSTISSKIAKGLFISHIGLFKHKNDIDGNKKILRQIYGDILELEPRTETDCVISDNNTCNIWGIDEFKFKKIIAFIDDKILPMIEIVKNESELVKFIKDKPLHIYPMLKGERVNSDFVPYCKMKFPDLNIDELLDK